MADNDATQDTGRGRQEVPSGIEVLELAEAMYEGWNGLGAEGLRPFLAEEAEWHDAPELPDARVVRGPDAIIELLHVWEKGGGGMRLKLEPREIFEVGDEWVAVATALLAGDKSGAIMLADEWCHVGLVRDGKVVRLRNFTTRAQAVAAAAARSAGG